MFLPKTVYRACQIIDEETGLLLSHLPKWDIIRAKLSRRGDIMTEKSIGQDVEGVGDTAGLPLVVGVDLGGTQIRTAVMRGATLLSRVGLLTGVNPTPERTIPRICTAIRQALDEAGVSIEQITGIGVGAPGPLDSRTGVVFAPPNLPGWQNTPLGDILRAEFHMPIYIENDANAAALGEYLFGAGQGAHNLVYLTISTGIGGGIITEGKILDGVSGTAGELGHMTIDMHGPRCNCGNIGCLERLASGTGIALRANEAIALGQGDELLAFALAHESLEDQGADTPYDQRVAAPHVNARTVALAAEAGIPLAREIIAQTAEALATGIVNILHIFNPDILILGGGVMQMGSLLLAPVQRIVRERTMRVPYEAVKIVMAQLGTNAGLVGAGALIYHHL
jgi:glucokinase